MKFSPPRGALSGLALAVATAALAQPMLAPAAQATAGETAPAAARSGTGWLATQLTDGVIHNDTYDFDDLGMTLDIGLSMGEVGGDEALVRQLRSAMSTRIEEYVTGGAYGDPAFRLAGELAKSLVFAQVSGADPATYGGYDLVTELERTVTTSGASAGRVVNYSPAPGWGDYANSFSQALAVRGLSVAGSALAAPATDFLLKQQCSSGSFRIFFTPDPAAANQSCVDGHRRHRHRHHRVRRCSARSRLPALARGQRGHRPRGCLAGRHAARRRVVHRQRVHTRPQRQQHRSRGQRAGRRR